MEGGSKKGQNGRKEVRKDKMEGRSKKGQNERKLRKDKMKEN